MALVHIGDSDPWIAEYDACEKLFRGIMERLTARDRESVGAEGYDRLFANIRVRMRLYNEEVQHLRNKVEDASRSRTITVEEAERRMRQIENLQSKGVQLQKLFDSRVNELWNPRLSANLLRGGGTAFADAGTISWAADEDEDDKPIGAQASVGDLMSEQDRLLQEQDKGLEELCKVIVRQKEIGQTISNEVEHQNEIIDDLADHMDRTDESLLVKTRHVQSLSKKDRTCGYWIVIVLLFVGIIVASFA